MASKTARFSLVSLLGFGRSKTKSQSAPIKKDASGYKCRVNVSAKPKPKWLRVISERIGFSPSPRYMRDKDFLAFVEKTDGQDADFVLIFNEAKELERINKKSLRENIYDLWREKQKHRADIHDKTEKVRRNPHRDATITREARAHLYVFSAFFNCLCYFAIVGEPEARPYLLKLCLLINVVLVLSYTLRFKIGRGPGASENQVTWVAKQLLIPLSIGGFAGVFLGAYVLNFFPAYADVTNDGYGGMLNLVKIFWADLVAHTR